MFTSAIDTSKHSAIKISREKINYHKLEMETTVFTYSRYCYSIANHDQRWVEEIREFYVTSDDIVKAVDGLSKLRLLNAFKRVVKVKAKPILIKPEMDCYQLFDDVISVNNTTYYNLYFNHAWMSNSSPVYKALYQLKLKRPYIAGLRETKLENYLNSRGKSTKVWR